MKTITLTRGMVALVDDSDFELVNQFSWHAVKTAPGIFYAARAYDSAVVELHGDFAVTNFPA